MSQLLNNAVIDVIIGGTIGITTTVVTAKPRIRLTMERNTQVIPIYEPTKIVKARARNVSKLEYKLNTDADTWKNIALDAALDIELSGECDIVIRIERAATFDAVSTVRLFVEIEE